MPWKRLARLRAGWPRFREEPQPLGQRNTTFIKTLLTADAVVIVGQAAIIAD
jgi:hypothetical protein